ncbi:MAG: hypothetical protein H7Z72_03995 [Bacteroidetes bacterium]|nr:hypothetical protein [Fibrella sp.]
MNTDSIDKLYHQLSARRDAINQHYLRNTMLKTGDPIGYQTYQREFRAINKRLRVIRQCIPANPTLGPTFE